jgi:tRNA threonylcarbamoyladenosine biosynthesis protein TsaB
VALWHKSLVASRIIEEGLRHNELLLTLIDDILRENTIQSDQINAIAVSSGPGSFTGLRVGMATAKGLCQAWHIPVIAIPTLTGLAATVPKDVKRVLSLMPARAHEVYWELFEHNGYARHSVNEVQLADVMQLGILVKGEIIMIGEGYLKHQTELDNIFQGRKINLAKAHQIESLIVSTARLAAERLDRDDFDDLMELEPLYCYPFPRRTE